MFRYSPNALFCDQKMVIDDSRQTSIASSLIWNSVVTPKHYANKKVPKMAIDSPLAIIINSMETWFLKNQTCESLIWILKESKLLLTTSMTKLKSIWNWPFFIHDYQVIMMDHPMRKQKRWKLMWMNSCHDQSWFATCAKNRERLKSSAIKGQKWPYIQMQTTKCCQPLLSLQWIWFFYHRIEWNVNISSHHRWRFWTIFSSFSIVSKNWYWIFFKTLIVWTTIHWKYQYDLYFRGKILIFSNTNFHKRYNYKS